MNEQEIKHARALPSACAHCDPLQDSLHKALDALEEITQEKNEYEKSSDEWMDLYEKERSKVTRLQVLNDTFLDALQRIKAKSHSWVIRQESACIEALIHSEYREIAKQAMAVEYQNDETANEVTADLIEKKNQIDQLSNRLKSAELVIAKAHGFILHGVAKDGTHGKLLLDALNEYYSTFHETIKV